MNPFLPTFSWRRQLTTRFLSITVIPFYVFLVLDSRFVKGIFNKPTTLVFKLSWHICQCLVAIFFTNDEEKHRENTSMSRLHNPKKKCKSYYTPTPYPYKYNGILMMTTSYCVQCTWITSRMRRIKFRRIFHVFWAFLFANLPVLRGNCGEFSFVGDAYIIRLATVHLHKLLSQLKLIDR